MPRPILIYHLRGFWACSPHEYGNMIYMSRCARCWGMSEEHTTSSKYFQDSILEVTECTLGYRDLAQPHNPTGILRQAEAWWPWRRKVDKTFIPFLINISLLMQRHNHTRANELLSPGFLACAGGGVPRAGKRSAGASGWWWVPTKPAPQPKSLKEPELEGTLQGGVLTFSSCMVNSLPCSLALFIMKSRASLWSSVLFLFSFSCIAFSINSCSISRALIPCGRQT